MFPRYAVRIAGLFLALLLSPAGHAKECAPTPTMREGTHFEPVTREQEDVGKGLLVQGRVLAAPDCRPVPGARIVHWQAGETGKYVDHLRAWLTSGADGGYRFETEWPALPAPHIHFMVTAEGFLPLTTQWVGDAPVEQVEFDIILTPE